LKTLFKNNDENPELLNCFQKLIFNHQSAARGPQRTPPPCYVTEPDSKLKSQEGHSTGLFHAVDGWLWTGRTTYRNWKFVLRV